MNPTGTINIKIIRDEKNQITGVGYMTEEEVTELLLRHARSQIAFKGEYIGIREMRKHAAWYTSGYKHSAKLRGRINEVETYRQLEELFLQIADRE